MTAMPVAEPMTAEEFLALPDGEHRWSELVGGDRDVYQPDLVWYRASRTPKRDDPPPYDVPDLAVEIRSPSTWRYDIGAKKSGYERRGLPELWLVDTAADEVLVFRRSTADAPQFDVALELTRDDALTSPQLPGFTVALRALFGE
jgi:Uma2 family endonuclease